MTPVVHGSFAIERVLAVPRRRVFAAWVDAESKARWFVGPPDRWTLVRRELDLRVGGLELLEGRFDDRTTRFSARYHAIEPDARLVYAYDMHVGGKHLSTSLATVELVAHGKGTKMTFTEQAAFYDGEDGSASRRLGTEAHFDRLAPVLDDPRDIVSSRVLAAPRERVHAAFTDPAQLIRWWGPKGFSSTFAQHDLRVGGTWTFTLHGPDGTSYPNQKTFLEVSPARVVLRHGQVDHGFVMTMTFTDLGAQTLLTWRLRFDQVEAADASRARILEANEENFDRLAAVL